MNTTGPRLIEGADGGSVQRMVRQKRINSADALFSELSRIPILKIYPKLLGKFFRYPDELGDFLIQSSSASRARKVEIRFKPSNRFSAFLAALWALNIEVLVIRELAHKYGLIPNIIS